MKYCPSSNMSKALIVKSTSLIMVPWFSLTLGQFAIWIVFCCLRLIPFLKSLCAAKYCPLIAFRWDKNFFDVMCSDNLSQDYQWIQCLFLDQGFFSVASQTNVNQSALSHLYPDRWLFQRQYYILQFANLIMTF